MLEHIVLAAAILSGGAPALQTAAPVDTVRLRFNWLPGTVAEIESARFRERFAEKTDTLAGSARYRMKVAAHPEGRSVEYSDFDFGGVPGRPRESRALQAIAEQVSSLVPNSLVSGEGDFLRVQNVNQMRTQLDSLLGPMVGGSGNEQALAAIAAIFSEDALNMLAAQEWNALVGMWTGADLELGETYELQQMAALPMIPGATVPMISQFSVVERVSCLEEGDGEDCVEIHLVSFADPDAMKDHLQQFIRRLSSDPKLAASAYDDLAIENELVLVTEPATLLPHRASITKSISGTFRAREEKGSFSQLDVRTDRYRYER
jgi:hypothetical protein